MILTEQQKRDEKWLRSWEAAEFLLVWAEERARAEFLKAGFHLTFTFVFWFDQQDQHVDHEMIASDGGVPQVHEERSRASAKKNNAFATVFIGQMAPEGQEESLQVVVEHVDFVCLVGSVAKISDGKLGPWDRCNADNFSHFLPS